MPRFIIHIGYGKTGTTALQVFLRVNRLLLAQQGILYPDFRHWGIPLGVADHNMVGNALIGQLGWLKLPVEEYFRQIAAQTAESPNMHTVLMSGETFLGNPRPYFFETENEYWSACRDKLVKLKSLLADQPATFIMYVRRQDDWLEASLNQTIKFEGLSQQPPDTSVEGYTRALAPRLDYYRQASLWAEYFGKNAIRVGIYDRHLLKDGDIVTDFIERAGLPAAVTYRKPSDDPDTRNDRLCRDVLEFKRILNQIPRSKEEERALAVKLRAISRDMMTTAPGPDTSLLSPGQRRRLLQQYSESNTKLVTDFMSGSAAALAALQLDQNPYGEQAGDGYPGLSIYKTIEIMHRLDEKNMNIYASELWLKLAHLQRKYFPAIHALVRLFRNRIRDRKHV